MFKFKKGKEYNLYVNNFIISEWNGWEYNMLFVGRSVDGMNTFTSIYNNEVILSDSRIIEVAEPVSATEMFQMYTNWKNFYRKGIHQDLRFAQTLQSSIINTLNNRKHVMFGTGKLEPYDYRLMHELRNDIDSGLYQFEVGKGYTLQNGDVIKIIARNKDMVCGSDGIWRYDYTIKISNFKSGMVHNTSYEFIDGLNIINELYGNRYELSKEFQIQFGYSDNDMLYLGERIPINGIDRDWIEFLKTKGMHPIHHILAQFL